MIGSAYPHLHLSRDAAVLKSTERLCKPHGDAAATLMSEAKFRARRYVPAPPPPPSPSQSPSLAAPDTCWITKSRACGARVKLLRGRGDRPESDTQLSSYRAHNRHRNVRDTFRSVGNRLRFHFNFPIWHIRRNSRSGSRRDNRSILY